jgi:hypothetical protein
MTVLCPPPQRLHIQATRGARRIERQFHHEVLRSLSSRGAGICKQKTRLNNDDAQLRKDDGDCRQSEGRMQLGLAGVCCSRRWLAETKMEPDVKMFERLR